jgi:IS5 family transposase
VGLTKRGKESKVMLVVEGQGLPLGVLVERAQKAEVRLAETALAQVKVPRRVGRPRTRPKELVADRGYDSEALRRRLRARGIKPCMPRRRNARPRRGGSRTSRATGRGGWWRGPSPGWGAFGGWW